MALQSFVLVLDNPTATFVVGKDQPTMVTGRVNFISEKTQNIQALKLTMKGAAKVRINAGKTTFFSEENLFCFTIYPAGGDQAVQVMLNSGEHSYPFSLPLPPGMPSTLRTNIGAIVYELEAVVERTWKTNIKAHKELLVVGLVDLIRTPDYLAPPMVTAAQYYGSSSNRLPVTMTLRLRSRNIIPGEDFPINVHVQNDSNVNIKYISGMIKRYVTFRTLPPEKLWMATKKVVCTFKLDAPKKKSSLSSTIILPPINESGLNYDACSIIDVDDMLIIRAVTGCFRKEAKIKGRVNLVLN